MRNRSSVETVVVTGSRIPQQGLYSSSPVTAVGQQEIQLEGTTSVETLISRLPSAVTDQNNFQANGATGIATVNLRGLGSARTLVLIDGKRLMPGDPVDPVPDLNNIPAALVDHVEVLTGGASSTYGSDAVAGVVNFIMRKDFEGIELDGEYSIDEDSNSHYPNFSAATASQGFPTAKHNVWDGGTVDATLIIGANSANGKGNVTAYLGYRNIQTVLEAARDFSACSALDLSSFGVDSFRCSGSSNNYAGRFNSLDEGGVASTYSTNPDQTDPSLPDSLIPRGNTSTPGTLCGDHVPLCSFNYAPFNYLQRPDTRYTGGYFAHYQLDKMLDVYSSLMFTDDHTVAQIAPSGLFAGSGPAVGAYTFNCDNPFLGPHTLGLNNAWDLYCYNSVTDAPRTGDATVLIGRRFAANPLGAGGANLNRQDDLRHTTYRMLIGAKGDLGDGWSYDFSAQYATALFSEEYFNDASASRIEKALHVVADPRTEVLGAPNPNYGLPVCKSVIDGTDTNCIPLNIFQYAAPTDAALAYAGGNGMKQGSTTEQVISLNITGDLGSMGGQFAWAKDPIAVAVGAEYRQEQLDFRPDYEIQTGDLAGQGGPAPRVNGMYHVSEFYGEVRVPVIQGQEFFEDLTLNGAYRYSDYSTVGSVSTYKYGAEWQPIDDVRFRGSFARAVRAPNVLELFTPQFIGLYSGLDPCSGSGLYYSVNPLSAGQCARTGVSGSQYANEFDSGLPGGAVQRAVWRQPQLEAGILRYEDLRHRVHADLHQRLHGHGRLFRHQGGQGHRNLRSQYGDRGLRRRRHAGRRHIVPKLGVGYVLQPDPPRTQLGRPVRNVRLCRSAHRQYRFAADQGLGFRGQLPERTVGPRTGRRFGLDRRALHRHAGDRLHRDAGLGRLRYRQLQLQRPLRRDLRNGPVRRTGSGMAALAALHMEHAMGCGSVGGLAPYQQRAVRWQRFEPAASGLHQPVCDLRHDVGRRDLQRRPEQAHQGLRLLRPGRQLDGCRRRADRAPASTTCSTRPRRCSTAWCGASASTPIPIRAPTTRWDATSSSTARSSSRTSRSRTNSGGPKGRRFLFSRPRPLQGGCFRFSVRDESTHPSRSHEPDRQ